MIPIARIKSQPSLIIQGLKRRGIEDAEKIIQDLLQKVQQRNQLQSQRDALRKESNQIAKRIGMHARKGEQEAVEALKAQGQALKQKIQQIEKDLEGMEEAIRSVLYELPNVPHESVPDGLGEEANEVVFEERASFRVADEKALPHWEYAQKRGWIDFPLGAKISGSGFPIYFDKGAQLQRALITFFLDKAIAAGYKEVWPPLLVNPQTPYGTGQLPDKDAQMYFIEKDNLYLIPTAEVPVTNIVRDKILNVEDLPLKFCAYSPCFRREAGSYGKEVRGLNRIHQFDKVEIVQIAHPEHSYGALEEMVEYVKTLLRALELPFRVVLLCAGDLGFAAAQTYDMEVYS